MPASAKSTALVLELRDRIARRSSLAVGEIALDTDGGATFLIGTGAAGSQSMFIKGSEVIPLGSNIVGSAAVGYSQTVLRVSLELSTITGVSLLTVPNMVDLMGEVLRQGCRVELYMSPNTDNVGLDEFFPAQLVRTWDPDLQYRQMAAQ